LDVRSLLRCGGSTTETHPLDVLKAELSSDFMRLNVVVAEQLSAVRYISIATPLLHSRAPELLLLARSGYRVQVMLEAGQGCILSCARELSDANAALSEKLAALKSLLRDHASDSSPEDELLSLLSTGVARCACTIRHIANLFLLSSAPFVRARFIPFLSPRPLAPWASPQRGGQPVFVRYAWRRRT
jgi:hypothetical protein